MCLLHYSIVAQLRDASASRLRPALVVVSSIWSLVSNGARHSCSGSFIFKLFNADLGLTVTCYFQYSYYW